MKFMYENLEGIFSELLMVDERAKDPKKYKTIKLPIFIRGRIKDHIIKKALKSLDGHLNKNPTLDYDYIKDFFEFFKRTYRDTTQMYKLLPSKSKLSFEHGFNPNGEQYIKLYLDDDVYITWYQYSNLICINDPDIHMSSGFQLSGYNWCSCPSDSFSLSHYAKEIHKLIRTYVLYYLKTDQKEQ